MKHNYAELLRDEDLRAHLERGDTVFFTETVRDWKKIEQQVERLGFGHIYTVSRGTRTEPSGSHTHIRLSPLHVQAQA
jgi:diaminopimelate decarboxylase